MCAAISWMQGPCGCCSAAPAGLGCEPVLSVLPGSCGIYYSVSLCSAVSVKAERRSAEQGGTISSLFGCCLEVLHQMLVCGGSLKSDIQLVLPLCCCLSSVTECQVSP